MKRWLVALAVLVVFGMVWGCAQTQTTNPVTEVINFFCKPTAAQTQAAQLGETLAQTALTALASLSGNLEAAALSTVAIPVFNMVISGVCATQANWDAAVNAIKQANQQPVVAAMAKAVAPASLDAQLAYLSSIKWPKKQ